MGCQNLKIDKGSVQKPRIHHLKGTILRDKSGNRNLVIMDGWESNLKRDKVNSQRVRRIYH